MSASYPKGSEWRKWDLHIHTPASILNNGFGSDWDAYVKTLFTTIIEKGIAVVGITDYFTIDGYKKIKNEYLADDIKLQSLFSADEIEEVKKILVLPNIEFRSDVFVGTGSVNFHIVFSEEVSIKDIEEKFLSEIFFRSESEPNQPDRNRRLTQPNLEELGARLKSEQSTFSGSDLSVGAMNAVVNDQAISRLLSDKQSIFGGKYLFVTVADEDLSNIDWASRDHQTRKLFIQKSHFLFSSNEKTRQWGLGRPPYGEGVDRFLTEFRTLKPCLHGSDAHELKFIGHPCAKRGDAAHDCSDDPDDCELRLCWIKADPTFEGLKQAFYEPEARIAIQPEDPTPLKTSQCIATFRIGEVEVDPELKFADTDLPFNDSLVAVTGGKGSGKTALVDLIANMYEDRAFCKDKNSFAKRVSENPDAPDLNASVTLQKNQTLRKEVKERFFIEGASLVYVAQGELEQHVEDPAHLERYMNSLIFESNEIKDSELLFDYQNINDEVDDLNSKIASINAGIFALEEETRPELVEGLQKEEKKLAADLVDAQKKIEKFAQGLSPEKVKAAEEKQKQLTAFRDRKTQLTELGVTIREALKFHDNNVAQFNQSIGIINALAEKLQFNRRFEQVEYPDASNLRDFINVVREELRGTVGQIERFQKDLEAKERDVKEHAKVLDRKKELERGGEQVKSKRKLLEEKKETLASSIRERKVLFEKLLKKRVEQRNKYLAIISAFSENKRGILNDLEFTAALVFDRPRFVETMSELVDLRKIRIKGTDDDDSEIAFFTEAMLELTKDASEANIQRLADAHVSELLEKIVPNYKKAETTSRHTIYDAVFADYLSVVPSVKYKRVQLSKLSLGQKATVLIKIYLAQGEDPIAIDSHDDHLDNEFIMEELVKALRQAKQHRQVIIVSNNGNVVVNSDAEQVIIADRDSQGEISYVSGSLENPALRTKLLNVLEGGKDAFSKRQEKYRLV